MEVRRHHLLNGFGLYATQSYKKDEVIHELVGPEYSYPTRESIYVGGNIHVHDAYGAFVNHSFEPSTYIQNRCIIARRDVLPDDEITFDYNENEIDMACPFEVNGVFVCGSNVNQ